MMYVETITLIGKTYAVDDYGDSVATESNRVVFAKVKSIGMREKYEALQAGLNPELTFVLPDYLEYNNETEVVYKNERYRVIRTYRNSNTIEIVVTKDASA